jgi:hypothetical protein
MDRAHSAKLRYASQRLRSHGASRARPPGSAAPPALRAGDAEDDAGDHGWRRALPPLRSVDAAELRESAPAPAVEAQRRPQTPPLAHRLPRLAQETPTTIAGRLYRGGESVKRASARTSSSPPARARGRRPSRRTSARSSPRRGARRRPEPAEHAKVVDGDEVAGGRAAALRRQERPARLCRGPRARMPRAGGRPTRHTDRRRSRASGTCPPSRRHRARDPEAETAPACGRRGKGFRGSLMRRRPA